MCRPVASVLVSLLPFLLHATLGVPVGDVARPRLLVTMTVEEGAAISPASLDEIAAMARDIWRPYVDVVFARAGSLARTIEVDELRLVLTGRLLQGDGADGLGWIDFVDGEPARTITVSTTAVSRLMDATTWRGRPLTDWPLAIRRQFVSRALGRTVAHEMGHYLLRTKMHSRQGLMRSQLTSLDIMDGTPAVYRLDATQAATLWRRIAELARGEGREPARPAANATPAS